MKVKTTLSLLVCLAFTPLLYGQCDASFSISSNPICGNETVTFSVTNPSPGATYTWDFGSNNNTATGEVVSTAYPPSPTNMEYFVELTVQLNDSVSCPSTQAITVSATPDISVEGQTVFCLQSSSTLTSVEALFDVLPASGSYDWDFSNATIENSTQYVEVSNVYDAFGTYPLELSQTIGQCTGVYRDTVYFYRRPSADMNIDEEYLDICEGESVVITNGTESEVTFFLIDWGNGVVDTVFDTSPQEYIYELSNDEACTLLEDGLSQSFTVTLFAVAGGEFCSHNNSSPVNIIPRPRPSFAVNSCICIDDMPVVFDNTTCNRTGNTYVWNFGDPASGSDNTSTSTDGSHTYTQPGTYTVTLEAIPQFTDCGSNSISQTIEVVPAADASFQILGETVSCSVQTYTLDSDIPETCTEFDWTIQQLDGNNQVIYINDTDENSAEPEIQINSPGTYLVELEVTNACGTDVQQDTIVLALPPAISIPAVADACDMGEYSISASLSDNGCPIESCSWTITNSSGTIVFSDNNNCNAIDLSLDVADTYFLEFTSTNCCGPNSHLDTFAVTAVPTAAADYSLDDECTPSTVTFNNLSINNSGNSWEVNTTLDHEFIGSAEDPNAIIQLNEPGTYPIQLTVQGCETAIWDTTVTVFGAPSASLAPIEDNCEETTFTPSATIQDGGCTTTCNWVLYRDGVEEDSFSDCTPVPITVSTPGDYTLELTITNCCESVTIDQSFLLQEPDSISVDDVELCLNDPCFPLPANGVWTDQAGTIITEFCPTTVGDFPLTFTQTLGLCESADGMTITVHPLPDVDLVEPPTLALCTYDAPIQLEGTPIDGTWTSTGNGLSATGNFDPAEAGPDFHTITYSYTDANGCTNFDQIIIEVQGPAATNIADIQLCRTDEDLSLPLLTEVPEGEGVGLWLGEGIPDNSSGIFNSTGIGPTDEPANFEIIYFFTTAFGCESRDTFNLELIPITDADAGPDQIVCISDEPLPLTANLTGSWSSDSGVVTPGGLVDLDSSGEGSHEFYFVAFEGESCETRDTMSVTIIDMNPVEAGEAIYLCETDNTYTLSGFSLPENATGQWSGIPFDDPINGTFNVQSVPLTPQTYTLYYTATSTILPSCEATDSIQLTIHPLPQPSFIINGLACINETVTFENTSSGADAYQWFVNGVPEGNSTDLTYTFFPSGDYEIELRAYTLSPVSNLDTICEAIYSEILHISEPPVFVGFDATPTEGCSELSIELSNLSVGENLEFIWLQDGVEFSLPADSIITLSTDSLEETVIITLDVANDCGGEAFSQEFIVRPQPTARIEQNIGSYCSGDSVLMTNLSYGNVDEYFWYRNDTLISTDSVAPIVQWFTPEVDTIEICLITVNECGADTSCLNPIFEPTNVEAFYFVDTTEVCVGEPICFTNLSSPWAEVFYDFGDSTGSGEPDPCHIFLAPGTYQVQLKAFDCGFDTFVETIVVHPLPVASFEVSGTFCPDNPIQFENLSSPNEDYFWDFGDGDSSLVFAPSHSYDEGGTYTVCLTVTNNFSCREYYCQDIMIEDRVVAEIAPVDSVCVGEVILFASESSGNIESCIWEFSDGFLADSCVVERTFPASGDYTVNLIVGNSFGCQDTTTRIVHVRPSPTAGFEFEIVEDCAPGAIVHLTNLSTDATGIDWYIDGNLIGQALEFDHTFDVGGIHEITLTATNAGICVNESMQSVLLQADPVLSYELDYPCDDRVTNLELHVEVDGSYNVEVSAAAYFQEGLIHFDLLDDTYQVLVNADNGCSFDTSLTIVAPPPLITSITPDSASIILGESVQLEVTSNLGNEQISWFPPTWLSDSTSFRPEARPLCKCTVLYVAETTSERGCTSLDSALIQVNFAIDSSIYVPNVFTPNGDNRNDFFRVRSKYPAVSHVELFEIFDRFGELVFRAEDYDPRNLPPEGDWDGTFKEQPLDPANFIWQAKVIFQDGTSHTFHGEVKLVR